jgi:pimeloyl-ACP methyl ester carboxylesterase
MKPLYFDNRFGWQHLGETGASSGVGVVMCPAFAQEEVCTHHGWMALAQDLAAAGHSVIRFDYLGTGNGADADLTVAGLADDVVAAARALQGQTGVGRVVLMGLRLGAAAALMAAPRVEGLAGVALLAPVLAGTGYMRETRVGASVASLSGLDPVPPQGSDLPLNTNGFRWSADFQAEVNAIDLSKAPAPGVPSLLMAARGDRKAGKLAAAWRAAGDTATDTPFLDFEGWMQDPTTHRNPAESFAQIVQWVSDLPANPAPMPMESEVAVTLSGDGFVEEAFCFGARNAVFGVLCRPVGAAQSVAALLVHEGSTHSIGNGRAYVALARRLAREGYASLRFDLTGSGDSPAHGNTRNPHYDPQRIAECTAGLDLLEQAGYPQAVALGLCAGAYTAQELTLVDPRVVGNVLVNLQKFIWHYGDDIRVAARDNKRSFKAYLRAMRNKGEWQRALSGGADFAGIARVLTKRTLARARHAIASLFPPAAGSERAQVRDKLAQMSARGVQSVLLLSDEDPGLAEMHMHLGRKGQRLAAYAPVRMIVLNKADHHFNGTLARQRHTDIVLDVMARTVAAQATSAKTTTQSRPETGRNRAAA